MQYRKFGVLVRGAMSCIGTVLVFLLLLSGCSGGGGDSDPPAITLNSIEISSSSLSLPKGTASTLTALGHFSNGQVEDITTSVDWASTNHQVATVDAQGTVLSVAEGMAEISATATTAGSTTISSAIDVTVTAPALTSIDLHPHSVSLAAGGSAVFEASGLYSDGSRQDISDQVLWAVTDGQVASLDSGASDAVTVIAQQMGQTTVSATLAGVEATADLVVTNAVLESIVVSPAQLSIAQGTEQTLVALGQYSDQSQSDISHLVQWQSTDTNIATVDATGRVLGIAANPLAVQVEAMLDGQTGAASITVTNAVLTAIVIEPPQPSLAVGSELALVATGYFSDNTTQDMSLEAAWSVADPVVAEVSADALLRTLAEGETTITATLGMVSASTTLRVKANDLAAIHLTPATLSLAVGTQLSMSATGNYQDGSTQDLGQQVAWHTTNEEVATVDAAGRVTAHAAGSTRIVAQLGTVVGSVELDVSDATLESLAMEPASLSLAKGTTQQVMVVGTFSDGTTQDLTGQALWQIDNPAVASVDNTAQLAGLLSALSAGDATLSATVGAVTQTLAVTVTAETLTGLTISPASPTVVLGTTLALSARGTFSDGSTQDVTSEVSWHSSDYGVATVGNGLDRSGIVSGIAAGSVDIEAHLAGVSASVILQVNDDPQVPRSLSAIATPNVILNDCCDTSTVAIAVQAADSSAVVPDGTLVDVVVTEGAAVLTSATVSTVNGLAEVGVKSRGVKGMIVVQATVRNSSVSNTVPIYATDDFREVIGRIGVINASVDGGMLLAGSRLGLFIRNLSNRPFEIDAFYLFYAGVPVLEVTAATPLNNHQLAGGGQTGFVIETSEDVSLAPLDDFLLLYVLRDPATGDPETGTIFDVGGLFRL